MENKATTRERDGWTSTHSRNICSWMMKNTLAKKTRIKKKITKTTWKFLFSSLTNARWRTQRLSVTFHECKSGRSDSRRHLCHSLESNQRKAPLVDARENALFGVEILCEIKTLEADFADPAREVASMVAQFVSGLIAPHESTSFTSSHQNGSEENVVEAMNGYAWSVGDNPLSFTTPGSRFGSIHREIARRNIVVAQIDRVLLTYNRAVVSLERIDAKSDGVYEAVKSGEGKRLSAELRARKKLRFGI